MSRHESDREDLLREATALVERAELVVAGFEERVVVGFRKGGEASVFFGADPVYQFNAADELRRAYVGGLLYKAEQGRLVSLRRERWASEVALVRRETTDSEADEFVTAMRKRLVRLQRAMTECKYSVTGEWPVGAGVAKRIYEWLSNLPRKAVIAGAANVA